MYVFTYAVSDENANELFAEFHLGRRAFRGCKKGTKFCGWHGDMETFTNGDICVSSTIDFYRFSHAKPQV